MFEIIQEFIGFFGTVLVTSMAAGIGFKFGLLIASRIIQIL